MIKRLFSPPLFNTEQENFRAKFINNFIWAVITLLSFVIIAYLVTPADVIITTTIVVVFALILVMFLSLYVLRMGNLILSGTIIVVLGWLVLGVQAYTTGGVRDVIIIGYIAVSLLASTLINWRVGSIFIFLSIAAIWTLALLETNGVLIPSLQGPLEFSRDLSVIFIIIAILVYFNITSLQKATTRANKSEESLLASNESLQMINQTLEERVSRRTVELEKTNRRYERRVNQFEAISQVTRVITAIQDLDTLLPYITQVISENFNTYHTGIFLLDTKREFAVLRAANSDGGRRMLMRGHKLRAGQTGIVGFVAATGQARIALDVGSDVTYFDNPDMPETRSEIALPLRYAGQIIGALDVQSVEPNAFMQDDIEVLTTLADQVAATIHNAIMLEENRKEIDKNQNVIDEGMREYWKVMRPKSLGLGLRLIESEVQPLEQALEGEYILDAIAQNKAILHTPAGAPSTLAIPIRLRGKVIGVMTLKTKAGYKLTSDDAEIVEAVTERLSLAMETASLLQATQHRANIERITADVSSRISSSSRFETIMQTAAQEISRALGGSDVTVQIEPVSIELGING